MSKKPGASAQPTPADSEVVVSHSKEALPRRRHQRPRILLADMSTAWANSIEAAGYDVSLGTFGTPVICAKSSELAVVPLNHNLPDFPEQEIVFVDLDGPRPVKGELEEEMHGVQEWHQSCVAGVVNPRPLVMHLVRDLVQKGGAHSSIFIVTAAAFWPTEYQFGEPHLGYEHTGGLSSWSLFSAIAEFNVVNQSGSEIIFEKSDLARFLERGAEGARYSCTISPKGTKDRWLPLAKNKFGRDVAGMLIIGEKPFRGLLVLPEMPKLHLLAKELLEVWIAGWSPSLFPHLEGQSWVHRPQYELPEVLSIQQRLEALKKEYDAKSASLGEELKKVRAANPHWYALLRGTDAELVDAVIDALRKLGFTSVIDVDKEAKALSQTAQLREDIQIRDRSPILVVDVKGVRGRPEDSESTQSEKHATIRMREWKRTDVQPLTIINSQRHLVPEERDAQAYRKEIIDNARDTSLGLMTTWDVFNILRNATENQWPAEATMDIFYRVGRIDPVPSHYSELGKIVHKWEHSFGIVPNERVAVGDTLAIQVGDSFCQFVVATLRLHDASVQAGDAGQDLGVGGNYEKAKTRVGCRVFKVSRRP